MLCIIFTLMCHCMLYNVLCMVWLVHCVMCHERCLLYCVLCIVYCMLYTVRCVMYVVHCIPHIVDCMLYIVVYYTSGTVPRLAAICVSFSLCFLVCLPARFARGIRRASLAVASHTCVNLRFTLNYRAAFWGGGLAGRPAVKLKACALQLAQR